MTKSELLEIPVVGQAMTFVMPFLPLYFDGAMPVTVRSSAMASRTARS